MLQFNRLKYATIALQLLLLAFFITPPRIVWADTFPQTNTNPTLYPPAQMGAASQQVPAGAWLKIKFITPLDARTTNKGDSFIANAAEDLWVGKQLIIPKGTTLRGQVDDIQRPGFFSKGGLIRLNIDHIVMPSGELKPLSLKLDTASAKFNATKNALYTDPGIGSKLNTSVDEGISKYKYFHDKGIQEGQARGGGANMLLTVPTNTIAGVATGTAVTTVNAAKAIFGKGETVTIKPGDELILDFSKAASLQAE